MRFTMLLVLLGLYPVAIFAQVCQPDTSITATQGIFPGQVEGIPPAMVGVFYEHVSTVIVPADTMAEIVPGSTALVYIDSIVLDTMHGLPAWITSACNPPTCGFAGGDRGCVYFSGTPPQGEGGKSYTISFVTITYARLAAFPTQQFQQADTVHDFYTLYVEFGAGVDEPANRYSIFPNPASETLTLQLPDARSQFEVFDMQGKHMVHGSGSGTLTLDVRQWPAGLYLFRIWDGARILEQKIVVQ